MFGALFRPRLSAGAILALAVPLAVVAAGTVTIAAVAVRRDEELRALMREATASLKAGISADAAAKATSERFRQILEDIAGDIAPVATLARKWKSATHQTATPDKINTEPAPASGATPTNHASEVTP